MVKEQPSDMFASILKMACLCCALVGADIGNPKFRINWATRVVFVIIIVTLTISLSNVLNAFKVSWTSALETSCMMGSIMQGLVKFVSAIVKSKDYVSVRFILERLYADYQARGATYHQVMVKSCFRLRSVVKAVFIIYMIVFVSVILMPFVMLLFTGQRHMMIHLLLPYLDVSTSFGYFTTLGAHLICVLLAGFGLFSIDLFFLLYLTQALMFVDILKLKKDELNENCRLQKGNSLELLKDIIEWHQFYTEYNETCNNIFYDIITAQIGTASMSMLFSLGVYMFSDWPGVYALILLACCNLYVYCILGTRIETCNDEFCDEIYNIDWYNLPVDQRKMVIVMLVKAQCPSNIKVAGILPLSVNTGLRITKTIYSLFMMMIQFGEE